MPSVDYLVSFVPTVGSLGTLIEYKEASSSVWIMPSSPPNPTTFSSYNLSLETGNTYDIRVSSSAGNCIKKYVLLIVDVDGSVCCPPGYTLSADETYCYLIETTTATPPSASENAVAKSDVAYSTNSAWIYDPGYASNGTGTSTKITVANPYWHNGIGNGSNGNTTDGPMNRCAVWSTTQASNQDVGFTVCIVPPSASTYYIGIGTDNYGIVRVNGSTIITQDPTAIDIQYSLGGACFKVWHIYPIMLQAGPNVVELIGHNISSVAALGAQIYNNTSAEIIAATSDGDLNIIFDSHTFVGQPIQIGSDNIGYTCPSGYSLVLCDGPAYCTRTTTTPTISC